MNIIMSDVNGTPRNPTDPNDNVPDNVPHEVPREASNEAPDEFDDEAHRPALWHAFTGWVDEYAWTIITLGVALILLDVLLVLVVLLWQVNR